MTETTSSRTEGDGATLGDSRGDPTTAATLREPSQVLGTQGVALLGLLSVAGIVATSVIIQSHVSATQRRAAPTACALSSGSYLERLDQLVHAKLRGTALVARASDQPD